MSVRQITVQALQQTLGSWQLVDVRTPEEFHGGHVTGAVNVPLSDLEMYHPSLEPDRPTAVICHSGARSSAACGLLARSGFTDLANVSGGTAAWIRAGLPVEAAAPQARR